MSWRLYLLTSVLTAPVLGGCQSSGPELASKAPPAPGVARSQDEAPPRAKPKSNFLDVLPEQTGDAENGEVAARIRATVNGYPIFEEEIQANAFQLIRATAALPEPDRTRKRRELYRETLDQLVERELLMQDAVARLKKAGGTVMQKLEEAADKEFDRRWLKNMKEANKFKSDEDLKEMLRRDGLSLDMIRRQWTRQFIATEYLRNRIIVVMEKIGHGELKEYYDTHPEEFKLDDGVEWLDLFVVASNPRYKTREDARLMADQLAARIRKGEDFLTLCREFNDGDSTARDGAGIGKKRGEIQPVECEEVLFEMKPGEVRVLEFGNGYHVFKLVKRDLAGKKPFDAEAQKEIRNKIRAEMYEREVKKLVSDLRKRAVIEYSRASR